MRCKFLLPVLFTLLSAPLPAQANAQMPEEFVRQFYAWYIAADNADQPAEMDNDIYRYVAKATVDRVRADLKRGGLPDGVSYFTKVQDYHPVGWKANTVIHPATSLNDGVTLVAESFGQQEKTDIVLFLKQEQGHWLIMKADDVLPWP
ncbi:DUF3828 domain-containing protein [Affinibrenneria salicis]|uniref:DUF3828 domain-containing protein n=1 Tax=Affinibrenneria salicis TaxID=2590031 RepID=A0A5J5G6P7_9GAMM|nr:DUF3828 domain-containing protein [Affinibrenneria salicis]KAA9002785.1 DUF3828 domain-containing protein [Affinibrenneria salicis]KAA9002928.1 DUF3828 domain-containing protein [Affinibrenneria salicis]